MTRVWNPFSNRGLRADAPVCVTKILTGDQIAVIGNTGLFTAETSVPVLGWAVRPFPDFGKSGGGQ